LVQLLVSGREYDRAYSLALLRLMLSVPDVQLHTYLAGLGLVPALLPLLRGPPALAAAAAEALRELSASDETNAMVGSSGAHPLLNWALSQWEPPPGLLTRPSPEDEED
jgi:hypothetical protein